MCGISEPSTVSTPKKRKMNKAKWFCRDHCLLRNLEGMIQFSLGISSNWTTTKRHQQSKGRMSVKNNLCISHLRNKKSTTTGVAMRFAWCSLLYPLFVVPRLQRSVPVGSARSWAKRGQCLGELRGMTMWARVTIFESKRLMVCLCFFVFVVGEEKLPFGFSDYFVHLEGFCFEVIK